MAEYTRRDFLRLAVVVGGLPALLEACAGEEQTRTVNFFNWSTYIGKETLPRFARETGVKVNYEEFADEEEMFAKIRSGARGYDLIVAADYIITRLKGLNLIDPYPPGVLANSKNLDPKFRNPPYDPENAFAVPYLWGTTGIGYNKARMARPPTSWHDLWDDKHRGKISMLDNARDCISTALLMEGYPETTTEEKAFERVKELFRKQRPLVKQYSSATYIDSLITGEVHLAMAWSGDCLQASRENPEIDYVVPKEGSYLWVDNLCLVRGSRHREDTLRLVDYLLEAKVGAEIADTVRYATPNAAAREHMDKALLKDPRVFPPPRIEKLLRFHEPLNEETSQLWNQLWSDIKVG